jgi:hypothetical protein
MNITFTRIGPTDAHVSTKEIVATVIVVEELMVDHQSVTADGMDPLTAQKLSGLRNGSGEMTRLHAQCVRLNHSSGCPRIMFAAQQYCMYRAPPRFECGRGHQSRFS